MKTSWGTVLVTGINGFVGLHVAARLLSKGYNVRGTVRDLEKAERVKAALAPQADVSRLSFARADLSADNGWAEAMTGCDLVAHVASPVPKEKPKNDDEVIGPARDGTLRVLRAAWEAKVKRVVMTSSISAVLMGRVRDGSRVYDESDWSDLHSPLSAYDRSKTVAEQAAWEFVRGLPAERGLELVAINPGLILGPLLSDDSSVSGEVVRKLLARELPGCPDLGWAPVDVRDVAEAHLQALQRPEAAGYRFIVGLDHTPWRDIALILARHFGPAGFRVPTSRVPSPLLRLAALFDKTLALVAPELGQRQDVSSVRAQDVLGWHPRNLETMVIDTAKSMIARGVVKP